MLVVDGGNSSGVFRKGWLATRENGPSPELRDWNGENGRTIMYQSEMPYDPPSQADWSHDGVNGFASYKVADSVKTHEGWGLGVYSFFNQGVPIHAERAFDVPNTAGVKLHDLVTVFLTGSGGIDHVVNKHRRRRQLDKPSHQHRQLSLTPSKQSAEKPVLAERPATRASLTPSFSHCARTKVPGVPCRARRRLLRPAARTHGRWEREFGES